DGEWKRRRPGGAVSGAAPSTVAPESGGDERPPRILRPVRQNSFAGVLRNAPFLRLWLSQALSQTANNMVNFALLLRVTDIVTFHAVAGANTAVSLVILSFSIPSVIFGPVAGVAADRMNRRTLMTLVNVGRAISVLLFILIRPTWHAQTILVAIYLITFLFGTISQFFAPAEGAAIPSLVPRDQLLAANSLFNLTFTATQLLGFAVFGPVLAKVVGVDVLFGACVALFAVCAGLTMTLPTQPPERKEAGANGQMMDRLWADIREGLLYILQDPLLLRSIVYLTLAATTFLMVASLGPEFVTKVIGLPPGDIGFIVAPAGLGVVLGVFLVPLLVRRFPRDAVIDWAIAIAGVMLALLALSRVILGALLDGGTPTVAAETAFAGILAAALGVCNACVLVPAQTILQERSHEQIRARVYATFFTISNTVAFIPIFFAAASADIFGVVQVLVVVALILIAVGVLSLLHRHTAEQARRGRVRTRHRQGPETLGPNE
ncbi:MAG TPA: MFS transporter, partial [Thermomicrobiales bacterium]|nr:MFS transporter [Thermomicrobiales bacterium]